MWLGRIEAWLEAERDQLPLWLPVMLGLGIAGWFILPDRQSWLALIAAALGLGLAGVALGTSRRAGFALMVAGLSIAGGCALAWGKAQWVASPVLTRPTIVQFVAHVERVQQLAAKDAVRAVLRPVDAPALPPRLRVNIASAMSRPAWLGETG